MLATRRALGRDSQRDAPSARCQTDASTAEALYDVQNGEYMRVFLEIWALLTVRVSAGSCPSHSLAPPERSVRSLVERVPPAEAFWLSGNGRERAGRVLHGEREISRASNGFALVMRPAAPANRGVQSVVSVSSVLTVFSRR